MVDFQRDLDGNVEIEDVTSSLFSSMLLCTPQSEENEKRSAVLELQCTPSCLQANEKSKGSSSTNRKDQSPTNNLLQKNDDDDDGATKKGVRTLECVVPADNRLEDISQFKAMLDHQLFVKNDCSTQRGVGDLICKKKPLTDDRSLVQSFGGLSVKGESVEAKELDVTHASQEAAALEDSSLSISCFSVSNTTEADVQHHDSAAERRSASPSCASSPATSRMMDLHSHQLEQETRVNVCAMLSQRSRNESIPLSPSQRQQLLQLQRDIFSGNQPLSPTIAATLRRNQQQNSGSSSSRATRKPKQRYAKSA